MALSLPPSTIPTEISQHFFPDGSLKPFQLSEEQFDRSEAYRIQVGQVWSEDISFVIDQFEKMDKNQVPSRLNGRIEMGSIGVIGHSFGGAASYDASFDPWVKAGVNMDGTLFGIKDKEATSKSFLIMYSESVFEAYDKTRRHYAYTDAELEAFGSTREEYEALAQSVELEVKHIQSLLRNKGRTVYIEGTEHINYTDLQFLSPLSKLFHVTGSSDPSAQRLSRIRLLFISFRSILTEIRILKRVKPLRRLSSMTSRIYSPKAASNNPYSGVSLRFSSEFPTSYSVLQTNEETLHAKSKEFLS